MMGIIQPFYDQLGLIKSLRGEGQGQISKKQSSDCTRPEAPFFSDFLFSRKKCLYFVRHLGWELLLLADRRSAMDTLSTFTYFPTENVMFQPFNG